MPTSAEQAAEAARKAAELKAQRDAQAKAEREGMSIAKLRFAEAACILQRQR